MSLAIAMTVPMATFYRNVGDEARASATTKHPAHAHPHPTIHSANWLRANEQSPVSLCKCSASKRAKGSQGLCTLCTQRFHGKSDPLFVCSQTFLTQLRSDGLCSFARNKIWKSSATLCSFARSAMTRKSEGQQWRRGRQSASQSRTRWMAMADLLKPSLMIVAGPTLWISIAKATAVAFSRIEQFLAIPLTGKVVVPCPVMAMPLFLFLCEGVADAHARANQESGERAIN